MGWVRTGSCPPERCQGRCCKHIGLWFDVSPEVNAFLDTLKVRGAEIRRYGEKSLADIPQVCQYLTEDNLCGLHPDLNPDPSLPDRPAFCEAWPEEPSQLALDPYCGFEFVEQKEMVRG